VDADTSAQHVSDVAAKPPQSGRPGVDRKRLAFGFITLAMVSLVVLGLCELLLRIAAPQPASWLDIYIRHARLPFFALQPRSERLVDTGETRWTIFTDDHGFRVAAPVAKQAAAAHADAGRPQAIVLGDSFTFAHGVDYEKSFVALLEQGTAYRYVNTAVPGYGPTQYRQILEDEIAHSDQPPRLIVAATFLGNDFQDCVWNKDVPVLDGVVGNPGGLKSLLKRNSHLYRLLTRTYHVFMPLPAEGTDALRHTFVPAEWQDGRILHAGAAGYERELARIAAIAGEHKARLLAVIIPARPTVEARRGSAAEPGLDYEYPLQRARDVLERLHIAYVDPTDVLARQAADKLFYAFDGHLTPLAHRLVMQTVAPRIPSP
jgi:hypothetical protein